MRFTTKAWMTTVAATAVLGATASTGYAATQGTASTQSTASTRQAAPASRSAAAGEAAQLRALYKRALAQGGELTVYMGGDKPGQWDFVSQAFTKSFPGIRLHLVTDLSKYQDARIDNQLATHDPVADVAILQTVQDFTQWKAEGDLLQYRPIGYNEIFSNAKDPAGYWTGVFYGAFADMVNTKDLPADADSFTAADLLSPKFKNKLIFTYPDDDDAVLYDFKLTVDKYGWKWLRELMAQHPKFVRGTPYSAAPVADGRYLATLGTAGDPSPDATMVFPAHDPFNTWVQHGAIFKQTRHKAAAELFMSWITSQSFQKQDIATFTWSVRKDVAPPAGLRPLATYKQTNVANFNAFMANRAAAEEFRSEVQLYVGQVEGPDPADPDNSLGLTPGGF
jgi:ABC-type Fe3+ transport system substrate-binding protein